MAKHLPRALGGLLLLGASTAIAAPHAGQAIPPSSSKVPTPIVGGDDVPQGRWRDATAVLFLGEQGCTGTLIAPTVVLTAGHCIDNELDSVLLGANSLAEPGGGDDGEGSTLPVARRHRARNKSPSAWAAAPSTRLMTS